MKYMCHNCGYETSDKGRFLNEQGTGSSYWMMFSCPQCALSNPPVSDLSAPSIHEAPAWKLVETNSGLRVRAGKSSSILATDHPLRDAPASLLCDGLRGTMSDHHQRLAAEGRRRAAIFHTEVDKIDRAKTDGTVSMDQDEYLRLVDEARKRHGVGPYAVETEHDGPTLMRDCALASKRAWL